MVKKIASVLLMVCLVWLMANGLAEQGWYAIDYQSYFRPAALALNPYAVPGFYNPPWTAWLLWPFAIMPSVTGQALMFAVALSVIVAVLWTVFKCDPLSVMLIVISYPTIYSLAYGNLEWLVLLGLLIPRPLGLILLMVKPQLGLGIALWWLWDAWKQDRWRGMAILLVPIVWLTLITSWLYRWNPTMMLGAVIDADADIWPWGLLLVPLVLRNRKNQYVLGQLVSPHLTRGSWIGLLLSIADGKWLLLAACLLSWALGLGMT